MGLITEEHKGEETSMNVNVVVLQKAPEGNNHYNSLEKIEVL